MKRQSRPSTRSAHTNDKVQVLPKDVRLLLEEIEKEPVPERLLELAVQLQEALVRTRGEREPD